MSKLILRGSLAIVLLGWTIWHYFPKPKKYRVSASFLDKKTGVPLQNSKGEAVKLTTEIVVRKKESRLVGERTGIEVTTFLIALGVALIGLVGGAREQLLKLDPFAGIIGIFLIGFSADTIKNLLTQSSRAKETKPAEPETKPVQNPAAPTPKPVP